MVFKNLFILFVLFCFLCTTSPSMASSCNEKEARVMVSVAIILMTAVFAIWTQQFISNLLTHSGLGNKEYQNNFVGQLMIVPIITAMAIIMGSKSSSSNIVTAYWSMSYLVGMMMGWSDQMITTAPGIGILGLAAYMTNKNYTSRDIVRKMQVIRLHQMLFLSMGPLPIMLNSVLTGQSNQLVNNVTTPTYASTGQ